MAGGLVPVPYRPAALCGVESAGALAGVESAGGGWVGRCAPALSRPVRSSRPVAPASSRPVRSPALSRPVRSPRLSRSSGSVGADGRRPRPRAVEPGRRVPSATEPDGHPEEGERRTGQRRDLPEPVDRPVYEPRDQRDERPGGGRRRQRRSRAGSRWRRRSSAAIRNPANRTKPTIPVWASRRNSRLWVQRGSSPVWRRVM